MNKKTRKKITAILVYDKFSFSWDAVVALVLFKQCYQ